MRPSEQHVAITCPASTTSASHVSPFALRMTGRRGICVAVSSLIGAMIWDASDANPMHRRLPAEVVSRRPRKEEKSKVETKEKSDEVVVDLKTAITLKPEARTKWLSKVGRSF